MTHEFDKQYWERHWHGRAEATTGPGPAVGHLARELRDLAPGTALDAGCGTGAAALWLAEQGWRVTAADLSSEALALAADRASGGAAESVRWVETDLTTWDPGAQFDLVTTHYAHPATSQLDFYARIARWVAPGGTLLVLAHLHGAHHVAEAAVTAEAVTGLLAASDWEVVTAAESGHDVVVRAVRRSVEDHAEAGLVGHDVPVRPAVRRLDGDLVDP